MTDQEKSDHWELLASELGAKPPFDEPRDEPVAGTEPPEVPQETTTPEPAAEGSPKGEAAPGPKRPTSDWDALAGELGIVLPPAAHETVTEGPPVQQPANLVEEPAELVEEPAELVEEPAELVEEPAELVEELGEAAEEAADLLEEPVGGTGIMPVAPAEKRPARRRRKRRRKVRDSDETVTHRPEPESADEVLAAAGEEAGSAELGADAAEPNEARPKRRRKRRTPSRKKQKEPGAEDNGAEDDSRAGEPGNGWEGHEPVAGKKDKSAGGAGDEDRPTKEPRSGKTIHRAIPTWEEAVGLIVSHNLEARAKKPASGSSHGWGAGRGSSKGRGSGKRPPKKKH